MSDAAPPLSRRDKLIAGIVYALAVVGVVVYAALQPVHRNGDGWEYRLTLEAIAAHGTPDVRGDDEATMLAYFEPGGIEHRIGPSEWANGLATAPNGERHAIHFWGYSLTALPAKFALRLLGLRELGALTWTNAAWFLIALGTALFRSSGPLVRRLLFAACLCVGPAVWYIPFTGAETFSWALASLAVVHLDANRYGRSALFAGLAATQNPPLLLLAGVPVLAALCRREWRSAGLATLGAATAFLPAAFYLWTFGKPSLIAEGFTSPKYISVGRTLSLFLDLNQGLLPYVPLLLLAAVIAGGVVLFAQRDVRGWLLALALTGMLIGVQVQVNWNSDSKGLMRYLLWMLPPLAWLAVEGVTRWRPATLLAVVLVHGAVVVVLHPWLWSFIEQRPVARWVLTTAPYLYNPEHEIFIERQLHGENVPRPLPIAFGKTNGEVTKLLFDRESASRLTARFSIDPAYLPELQRLAEAAEKPVYVHPPKGTVTARPWSIHGQFDATPDLGPKEGP